MTFEELTAKCAEKNIVISPEMNTLFEAYLSLLQEWNQKINLTAITETGGIIEKHFYDCILPLTVKEIHGKVADVGSGAGFPGIVWKIVRPDLDVTLIEPTGKRCTFLNEVIDQLHLKNIRVVNERAEDHAKNHREEYDVVTARAVANLRILSELCVPLVKVNGLFIAMKGMHGEEEAADSQHAMKELGAVQESSQETSLENGDHRVNLFYRKANETPSRYPRNYGQIKKKPL